MLCSTLKHLFCKRPAVLWLAGQRHIHRMVREEQQVAESIALTDDTLVHSSPGKRYAGPLNNKNRSFLCH